MTLKFPIAKDKYCNENPNERVAHSSVEGAFKQHLGYEASLKCSNGYKVENGEHLTAKCTDEGPDSGTWVPSSTCKGKALFSH